MLAVLLVVLLTPCYGYFTYARCLEAFQPRPAKVGQALAWERIRLAVDLSFAMTIFWRQVRLALSVAVRNRQHTIPGSNK
jgi:hypothetical protein